MKRENYRGGMPPEPPVETTPGIYVGNYRDPVTHEIVHGKHPWAGQEKHPQEHEWDCWCKDCLSRPLYPPSGVDKDAEIARLRAAVAQLEPRAAFGDQCYQDQCENAYVEQSVVKRVLDQFVAVADKHRESAALHADICSSGSNCEVYRTKMAVAGAIESALAGLPVSKRGAVKSEFVNELNNPIHVEVSDAPLGQIRILIRGPVSENENIVTRMEASEIHRALGTHLATNTPQQPEKKPERKHNCHCPIEDWRDLPTGDQCPVCKGSIKPSSDARKN